MRKSKTPITMGRGTYAPPAPLRGGAQAGPGIRTAVQASNFPKTKNPKAVLTPRKVPKYRHTGA